jgi:hypothetical protein
MTQSKLYASLLAGMTMMIVAQFALAAPIQKRTDYSGAVDRASAVYKDARAKCDALKDNPKDVCVAEAKAAEKRAKAEAEANYMGTVKARTDARIANADAAYMVASAKCDAQTGNEKNVCLTEAKAKQTKAIADAKANKTAANAHAAAREDTRDAEYKVALAKCDAQSGTAKDTCVNSAKSTLRK